MSSGIYKWTSKSNKSYIGQTINLEKRFREFIKPNSTYTSKNSKIDNARIKYHDFENDWTYEVLEECEIDKLDEREAYWIDFYDTKENGYNSTLGGEGNKGWKMDDWQKEISRQTLIKTKASGKMDWWWNSTELKEQTSRLMKGKKLSEETKQKLRDARAKQVITQESIDKTKEAMRIKRQNGWVNEGQIEAISKKVGQYNLDGELVATHSSLRNTAKAMNKKDPKLIRMVCQGKRTDVYGYIWKFV